jgi:hypothetical protein
VRRNFLISFLSFASVFTVLLGDIPVLKNGLLNGILTAKGEAWIEVKDDKAYTHRYLASWTGKGPSRGGSFDVGMLEVIDQLVVGNRVSLKWFWDDHLRIEEIEVIMPEWEGELFEGYVLEIGDKWVDVQNKDEGVPWRFYLPWVGGYPSSGGGYDQAILEPLREHQPTSPVIFEWNYLLRPRIMKLFTREEITKKAFYDVEEIPPWLGPSRKSMELSPFDLLDKKEPNGNLQNTINPFDGLSTGNANPFDKAQSAPINPFASVSSSNVQSTLNPFDNVGGQAINPFEASSSAPINPFDQQASKQVDIKSEKVREKLEEIVFSNLKFKDMSLQDVLSELSKKSSDADREPGSYKGVRIFFETAGDLTKTSISLDMADIKLVDALNQVAEQVGWNYRIVEGLVIFSRKSKTVELSPFEQAEKNKDKREINPFEQAVNN